MPKQGMVDLLFHGLALAGRCRNRSLPERFFETLNVSAMTTRETESRSSGKASCSIKQPIGDEAGRPQPNS